MNTDFVPGLILVHLYIYILYFIYINIYILVFGAAKY